jgi:hypothetical protein
MAVFLEFVVFWISYIYFPPVMPHSQAASTSQEICIGLQLVSLAKEKAHGGGGASPLYHADPFDFWWKVQGKPIQPQHSHVYCWSGITLTKSTLSLIARISYWCTPHCIILQLKWNENKHCYVTHKQVRNLLPHMGQTVYLIVYLTTLCQLEMLS